MSGARFLAVAFAGLCAVLGAVGAPGEARGAGLENGGFETWEEALPAGWRASAGATRAAEGPVSQIRKASAGGVVLDADAKTAVFRLLSQSFAVEAGKQVRLRFEARAEGLRKDEGQFGDSYVGLVLFDGSGRRLAFLRRDVTSPVLTRDAILTTVPEGAVRAEAWIFLSKTGRLEVRSIAAGEVRPEDSFAILVADMERSYSHLGLLPARGVEWAALAGRYRARAEAASADPAAFASVLKEMLAELRDLHVWIRKPGGEVVYLDIGAPELNFDFRAVAGKLASVRPIHKVGFAGRTADGLGYLAVATLVGPDEAPFNDLEAALAEMLDAPGLIVDLRGNVGGQEVRAQRLAALLADERRIYARTLVRSGPGPADLAEVTPRAIGPRPGKPYARPIVCLVGPLCVSSGEGFALMMKALPHATLVGSPTRGASGNPAPVELPNGVAVFFSRWAVLLPDGTTPLEGRGVVPDIEVAHVQGKGDVTFDAGLAELRKRVEAARPAAGSKD